MRFFDSLSSVYLNFIFLWRLNVIEKMKQESNLQVLMTPFWQALVDANDELNTFINGGLPSMTEKRHKGFVRKWDALKEKASNLCDQIEKQEDLGIDPIEVVLPWNTDSFRTAWQEWKDYLADNPRRLAIRRAHPDLFRVRFGYKAAGREYAAIGNRFLLDRPEKMRVQLSRSLTDKDIENDVVRFLNYARQGIILISPAISDAEKAVMRAVLNEGLPLVFLTPWGFNSFSKPGHQYYEACADGRFLILAPWEHQNERVNLTRAMCLELNEMAQELADS